MRLGAGIVGAWILAVSAAVLLALPQSGEFVLFDADHLKAAGLSTVHCRKSDKTLRRKSISEYRRYSAWKPNLVAERLRRNGAPSKPISIVNGSSNGDGAVVPYLNNVRATKKTAMSKEPMT
jgi:hypothetical protein